MQAQLVVIRPSTTNGLLWELERAVQLIKPERLLLLVPHDKQGYELFCHEANRYLPYHLPKAKYRKPFFWDNSVGALIYFEPDWTPHYVKLKVPLFRNDPSYAYSGMLKAALKPVFEQLHLEWKPPPVPWRTLIFCLVLLLIFLSSPTLLLLGNPVAALIALLMILAGAVLLLSSML